MMKDQLRSDCTGESAERTVLCALGQPWPLLFCGLGLGALKVLYLGFGVLGVFGFRVQ